MSSHRKKKKKPFAPDYKPAAESFIRNEAEEQQVDEALAIYERLAGIRVPYADPARRLLALVRAPAFADQICQDPYVKAEAIEVILAYAIRHVLLGQMFESQKNQVISELKEMCARRDARLAQPASSSKPTPKPASPPRPSSHRQSHSPAKTANPLLSRAMRREAAKAASKKDQFISTTCLYSGCGRTFATQADFQEAYCSKKCEHLDLGDQNDLPGLPPERPVVGWDWQKVDEGHRIQAPAMGTSRYTVSRKQTCEYCHEPFFADQIQRFCSKDCVQAHAEEAGN